jgi:hypothetical protein
MHIADVAALDAVASGGVSTMVGKLPKNFRSGQCLAQMDALVRSIE